MPWIVAALLVLLLVVGVVAARRLSSLTSVAALFAVPALVVIAWSAWTFADSAILRQRAEERAALATRAAQLTAAAILPGSPLACLDADTGEVVAASCEAAVFGRPETIAAAASYVEARLRLLADSLDYSRRADRAYANTLTQLRRGLEIDRYGFVAHVLVSRDGCTVDSCAGFALLRDAAAVKAHIAAHTFDNNVARYAGNWPGQTGGSPVASASPVEPLPGAVIPAVPVNPIDFPSAASIPPVSIMTEPPATNAAAPKPNTSQPPAGARAP